MSQEESENAKTSRAGEELSRIKTRRDWKVGLVATRACASCVIRYQVNLY